MKITEYANRLHLDVVEIIYITKLKEYIFEKDKYL